VAAALVASGWVASAGVAGEGWRALGPEGGTVLILRYAPADHRVVYAATFAHLPLDFSEYPLPHDGGGRIFRSTDGGATWNPASNGLSNSAIHALAVDPQNAEIAYVGDDNGVWKTTSGGERWFQVAGPLEGQPVTALAIAPGRPSTIYGGTSFILGNDNTWTGQVYRSDDGGRTWVLRSGGLSVERLGGIAAIAVSAQSPDSVIAIEDDGGCVTYWKSSNGGRDWHPAVVTDDSGFFFDYCPDASGIQQDPTTNTLYISSSVLVTSRDFGETWNALLNPDDCPFVAVVSTNGKLYRASTADFTCTGGLTTLQESADGGSTWTVVGPIPAVIQMLAADAGAPEGLLAGAVQGGLFRSVDGGLHWSRADHGLVATVITGLAADTLSGQVYVGTGEAGVLASQDGGRHWRPINPSDIGNVFSPLEVWTLALAGDELWVQIDVDYPPLRSSDGGKNWTQLGDPNCNDFVELVPDRDGRHAFGVAESCDTDCGLLESSEGGLDWHCSQQDFTGPGGIFVDPVDPRVVYGFLYTSTVGGLWKSIDDGRSFSLLAALGFDGFVLAVSPTDHRILWAGSFTSGVYRSTDQGASWSRRSMGLPAGQIAALVADPSDPQVAYVEVDGRGVFRTINGGGHWQPLPGVPVELLDGSLAIGGSIGQRYLYAGTAGEGLYAVPIP